MKTLERNETSRVPIDVHWAWLCCLGAFISMYYSVGAFKSMGVLFPELISHFGSSSSLTALVMGLSCAGLALFSPVAGYLCDLYGHRLIVMLGALIGALGAFVTAFAPDIYFAVAIFGCLNGIGNAFMLTPSLVIVAKYFKRWRTLANGLAMSGGSLGQLTIPWVLESWLIEYKLQGTLVLYAGHFLHAMIGGALLRPISFYDRKIISNVKDIVIYEEEVIIDAEEKEKLNYKNTEIEPLNCSNKNISLSPHNDNLKIFPEKKIENDEIKKLPILPFFLFKNPLFCSFVFGLCMGNCGYVDSILYLPALSKERDHLNLISPEQAAINSSTLMSLLGICDLIGRVIGGVIADMKFLKRSILASLCLFIMSIICMITALDFNFNGDLYILSLILGIAGGLYSSVFSIILMDYLGMNLFPRALSFSFMFMGLTNTALPPILGLLKDIFGNYNSVYLITSIMMFLASLSFASEKLIMKISKFL